MNEVKSRTGVLLLAHGSPDKVDEVPEFLGYITRGRPILPEVVEEVKHRYGAIGQSPLTCWTLTQRDQLQAEIGLPSYIGMRNWKPFIADAIKNMESDGIARAIVICMAPHNSRTSVGLYRAALGTPEVRPFAIDFVESWHDHPLLISAFAEKLKSGWKAACQELGSPVPVVFTAHSVPQRTIAEGDPYEKQARETAALVAKEAGLQPSDWVFAFQSQGMSGGEWLGPTVEDTIMRIRQQGDAGVFIQPIGFLCDHVEVLYDIDIGFKQFAAEQGMRLWRADSLNDSPVLTSALAQLVRSRLQ
jgi:protoporphyrin/coproporphyrin ferrochelatase